jgi:MFS family permease
MAATPWQLRLVEGIHARAHYGYLAMFIAVCGDFFAAVGTTYGVGFFVESWVADMGSTRPIISASWTAAMLGSALALPLLGRLVDRYGMRVRLSGCPAVACGMVFSLGRGVGWGGEEGAPATDARAQRMMAGVIIPYTLSLVWLANVTEPIGLGAALLCVRTTMSLSTLAVNNLVSSTGRARGGLAVTSCARQCGGSSSAAGSSASSAPWLRYRSASRPSRAR